MYPSITSVLAQDNYQLGITFNNGERGVLDMKPYLDFGIFQKLKETVSFSNVSVAFDTVEWSDVEIDLDPEFVYEKSVKTPLF
jgi:hypothetical protein